jgi:hypothetical protein
MNWLRLFRQGNDSTRRLPSRRRPVVEALEGRQLLSGIQGNHIGVVSDAIQGNHIGYQAIQGNHIGYQAIQGNHIGYQAIQGNHIGSPMIVGNHIGTSAV